MNALVSQFARSFRKRMGKQRLEKLVLMTARATEVNLMRLAFKSNGILNYKDSYVSGERFFIANVLKPRISPSDYLFDVGANVGEYSKMLREQFPTAKIFAFEPNPVAYDELVNNIQDLGVACLNVGLSSCSGEKQLHTYANQQASVHASIYREALTDLHKRNDLSCITFAATSLDEFCRQNGIDRIAFLKIDTEGHELEVLKGASRMISESRVGAIQFEFNEMNVISRAFLRDFYELLPQFNIYRLACDRMIPLGKYNPMNEIFKFQNLVALID